MKSTTTMAPPTLKAPNIATRLFSHSLGPEIVALILLFISALVGNHLSPKFLDLNYQLDSTSTYIEVALMALTMTFIIVSGNIDLSVASTMALVGGTVGVLFSRYGVPLPVALAIGLVLGALLGFINGALIVRLQLPSLTVTLGTYALYRGLAQVILGDQSAGGFPDWFTGINRRFIGNTPIPLPLVIFVVLAVVAGFILHRTVFGRWTVAMGTNESACRYSGIAVDRIKILLFTASGLMSGFAGIIMTSRYMVARYDNGNGLELDVITAVVLGGTSIFGGRGTILGTTIAFFLTVVLRNAMGLARIPAQNQLVVFGGLLLFSVILPNMVQKRRV